MKTATRLSWIIDQTREKNPYAPPFNIQEGNEFHFVKMLRANRGITFSIMLDTAKEASFEWSHQMISTTDSKVRTIHSKYIVPRKRTAEEVSF